MRQFRLYFAWVLILACFVTIGCRSSAKPPSMTPPSQRATTTAPVDIGRYLAATKAGTWVYRRSEQREHSDKPEVEYVRRTSRERLLEGDTTWNVFHTVERRTAAGTDEQIDQLTNPGGNAGSFAIRFQVADPLPLIPEDLTASSPSVAATRLEYTDLKRQPGGHGTLTRTATIEGTEDVDCPAGHFSDCLRIHVNLELVFRWGPTINWDMYLWLSPEAGDVKRVQQLSGWFLIFPFGSSFEYELLSHQPPASSQPADPQPLWKDGILAFDHGIPSPRIGALLVNFTVPSAAE